MLLLNGIFCSWCVFDVSSLAPSAAGWKQHGEQRGEQSWVSHLHLCTYGRPSDVLWDLSPVNRAVVLPELKVGEILPGCFCTCPGSRRNDTSLVLLLSCKGFDEIHAIKQGWIDVLIRHCIHICHFSICCDF